MRSMWFSTFRPGVVGIDHGFKTWYFMYHDFEGNNLVLHPGGEPLVEPEMCPPLHGDEVTLTQSLELVTNTATLSPNHW